MKFKNKNVNIEADIEKLVEKGIEQYDKNWKEKMEKKHNNKKEIQELRHNQKIELYEKARKKSKYELEIEEQRRKEELKNTNNLRKEKQIIKVIGICLIFIFGLFCITGFRDGHIIAGIISLIQICLLVVSILMCEDVFHIFQKDYKILIIASIILSIFWLAFAM